MATGLRICVCCWLMVACLVIGDTWCKPIAADAETDGGAPAPSSTDKQPPAAVTGQRTSRLQKPSSPALNVGFDEIVVESNLQVHRGAGSKNKSKITLSNPANSSSNAAASTAQNGGGNKSGRSLEV